MSWYSIMGGCSPLASLLSWHHHRVLFPTPPASGITLDFSSSSFDTRDPLDHIILATQLHWHGLPPREIELEERNRLVFFLFALVLPLLKFESIDTLSASESDSNASPAYLAMLLGCGSSFQQVGWVRGGDVVVEALVGLRSVQTGESDANGWTRPR